MITEALKTGLSKITDGWDEFKLHVTDLSVALEPGDRMCPRQLWLRLHGYDKAEPHYGVKLMWWQGHRFEKEIFTKFISPNLPGCVLDEQIDLTVFLPAELTGTADFAAYTDNGEEIVIDCKTSRGKNFDFLDRDGAKESNILQVQAYMMAMNCQRGILFYLDREGQNGCREFWVQRDDDKVMKCYKKALVIAHGTEPEPLRPKVRIKRNKSYDSVYIKSPWQCAYCSFRDVSCPGALPPKLRDNNRVCGKIENGVKMNNGYEQYQNLVEAQL